MSGELRKKGASGEGEGGVEEKGGKKVVSTL